MTDVQGHLERGFSSPADPLVFAQLPRLINQAERNISRELKIQGFIRPVNGEMQSGVPEIKKPDRWRETVSMYLIDHNNSNKRLPIFPRSYEYLRMYWPTPSDRGVPKFYADYDYFNWLVAPTPTDGYGFEVVYYELPPLLDETNQQNWLTVFAPHLLLYRTCLEASIFLKDDGRIALFQGMYDRAAMALDKEDMQKIIDRTTNRKNA